MRLSPKSLAAIAISHTILPNFGSHVGAGGGLSSALDRALVRAFGLSSVLSIVV